MSREFKLPDLGEGIAEAQIVRVLIKQGDTIKEDQPILEVETDKAAVEIPSPMAGKIVNLHVKEGQTVAVGEVMITFDDAASGSATKSPDTTQPSAPTPKKETAPAPKRESAASSGPPTPPADSSGRTTAAAAPAVRKLARDLGVDLNSITGTGPGGRVTREDVESAANGSAVKSSTAPAPAAATASDRRSMPSAPAAPPPPVGVADADKWGAVRRAPVTQIRKTIAAQMVRSAYTIPHVTGFDFADITELDKLRKAINADEKFGRRMTLMAFVMKAVATALQRHPIFNASFDHEKNEIIYKDYINIGVAVDTERGLVVPVVRNVERMSLGQIADTLQEVGAKARATQFTVEDLRGGTFTITNVGAIGGTFFTPIINYPESAILGMGRSAWSAEVVEGRIEPRYLLPIGMTFDHRIADGAQSARCLNEIIEYLQNPGRFFMV